MTQLDWTHWESLLLERGVEIDRPRGADHPRYPGWTYPLDYGFVPGTVGGDGRPVDVFVGTADHGLRAALAVRHDHIEELKLLWNTTEEEIQQAVSFLRDDMEVSLLRRAD